MSAVAETVEKAPRGGEAEGGGAEFAGWSLNVEGWDFAWERRGGFATDLQYFRAVLLHAVSTHVEEPLHDFLEGEG